MEVSAEGAANVVRLTLRRRRPLPKHGVSKIGARAPRARGSGPPDPLGRHAKEINMDLVWREVDPWRSRDPVGRSRAVLQDLMRRYKAEREQGSWSK